MGDSNEKIKVGVIFGGLSAEKEISLATGRYVYSLVDRSQFDAIPLYMASDARVYRIPDKLVIQNKTEDVESRLGEAEEIKYEKLNEIVDVMFIALLGKYGEDGAIQGLLELLKIPYTGSGILPSAVCMHKRVTKQILSRIGVTVPKDVCFYSNDWEDEKKNNEIVKNIESNLNYPVVVKPTREGSSVGVSFAKDRNSLEKAVEEAFKWDKEILAEEFVDGVEFMCVVLGNKNPSAMTPTEVEFEGEIHTYESKYMPGKAQYHTPPRVSDEMVEKVKETAVRVYETLGIKGYGRVDGFVVDNEVYVSEPHTGTIMVPSSYVFQQASRSELKFGGTKGIGGKSSAIKGGKVKAGISPRGLITMIINLAVDEHSKKKGTLQ
ncbi:D-alanine--D-alanine ligase [Candidatus Dojkabacteria bacterium]|nr:D-alanine--D-alanine ligase [Candidatus Dojkabacteria bacterium]